MDTPPCSTGVSSKALGWEILSPFPVPWFLRPARLLYDWANRSGTRIKHSCVLFSSSFQDCCCKTYIIAYLQQTCQVDLWQRKVLKCCLTLVSAVLFVVLENDTGDVAYTAWRWSKLLSGNWRVLHPSCFCRVACSKWCDFSCPIGKTKWTFSKPEKYREIRIHQWNSEFIFIVLSCLSAVLKMHSSKISLVPGWWLHCCLWGIRVSLSFV